MTATSDLDLIIVYDSTRGLRNRTAGVRSIPLLISRASPIA